MTKQQDRALDLETIGQTPRTAIWNKNKSTLWYYPAKMKKYKTPLFLVYSLVSKPYLLDLTPESSMIQAFMAKGYDVYLLDFGIPGYEDDDVTVDDYITKHIQKAVRRTLHHAKCQDVSVVGYCLGGTLSVIYAAIAKESIKNLILFAPPLDFSHFSSLDKWKEFLQTSESTISSLLDRYGVIPANIVHLVMRALTTPISITPYITLHERSNDKEFVEKWSRFNAWSKDHIPFSGAACKQLLHELIIQNKLIKNELVIDGQQVELSNIHSNLLVVSTTEDELVPEPLIVSFLEKVSSKDKTYKRVKGGHATLAVKGFLPSFLEEWLHERS
ncbi:alpha/beta fold hydrolase [Bacillus alkalicellulosilyticus]|uniref:alpha/beta fold hydrolase n=1 Tax=Alkalihalobacterium alkalicellulosilyticum TaxID=1912214 RepID=UPI000996AC94|nr:alpha/beta fold hydrolase [Bacillus alkalicellulosilyticus]